MTLDYLQIDPEEGRGRVWCWGQLHVFFVFLFFVSNTLAEIGKTLRKTKQLPETELLTNMSNKQVCLYQWNYMINCNENDNGKLDHINKT